jgi:hypothetical protein
MSRAGWSLAVALSATLLAASPTGASSPELYQVSVDVGRLEALLARAHFREAGEKALLLRSRALALPPSGDARRLLVRTEVVAATAAVALGQEGAARECFGRALQLDPRLRLAPGTPPKVRRSFDAVKATAR